MTKDISKKMYYSFGKILKQLPNHEIDENVDTSSLEKEIISFMYMFFETNYFNYSNKKKLPFLYIGDVSKESDSEDALAVYSESSRMISLRSQDVFEVAHGSRRIGDLINSLGHEYRHFLQRKAKEGDFETELGKEFFSCLEISLEGDYINLFEDDMIIDSGLDVIENFCKKKSLKDSKFADFILKTIKNTGAYANTINDGQYASQLHEEDARLAGLVFCSDFYNRMIREAVRIGDSSFEKLLKKYRKMDVKDSVEYTEYFAEQVTYFEKYVDILKEEPSDFFIKLAVEAYRKDSHELKYFLNKTIGDKCLLSSIEQLQDLVADILLSWDIADEKLKGFSRLAAEKKLTEKQQTEFFKCKKEEEGMRSLFAYILEDEIFQNKDLLLSTKEEKIVKNMAEYDMKRFKKIKVLKRQNVFEDKTK